MKVSRKVMIAAVVAGALVVTGAVAAVNEIRNPGQVFEPKTVENPLSRVEARPGECLGSLHLTWADDAEGAATPLAAVQRLYPDERNLREDRVDSAVVLERLEGNPARVVVAYLVAQAERDGWILLQVSRSKPCGSPDPAMPKPMDPAERRSRNRQQSR